MVEPREDLGGIMQSIRRFRQSLRELWHERAESFALEVRKARLRTIRMLAWLAAGIALGIAGLLIALGTLALFAWQRAGYLGLGTLAAGSIALAAIILWTVKHRMLGGVAADGKRRARPAGDLAKPRPRG